jgi:hypothetical protein
MNIYAEALKTDDDQHALHIRAMKAKMPSIWEQSIICIKMVKNVARISIRVAGEIYYIYIDCSEANYIPYVLSNTAPVSWKLPNLYWMHLVYHFRFAMTFI